MQTCIFKNSCLEGLEESSEAAASVRVWVESIQSVLVNRSVGNLVWARMPGVEPRAMLAVLGGALWSLVVPGVISDSSVSCLRWPFQTG